MREHVAAFSLLMLLTAGTPRRVESADVLPTMHRRPSAAVLSFDESSLYVANRRSGTLSTIDLGSGLVSERTVGQQLSALIRRPRSRELLAVDFAAAELIVFQETDSELTLRKRIETAGWPVAAAISDDGELCCVTSLWSRRVTIVSLAGSSESTPNRTMDLPFAPRALAFLDDQSVVVADAFGGRIAVVDCSDGLLVSVRELPLHNVRDVTRDGDSLLLTHQVINSAARTEAEHIHWGVLMQNEVSSLPVAALLDPAVDLDAVRRTQSVGGPGNGAGDPEKVVVLPNRLLVSLGGTGELALIDRVGVREVRVPTGARPVDVAVDRAGTRAFVVNELDDAVSIVDLKQNELVDEIVLGPAPQSGLAERGERAFFNARLSLENWMSCHSCHTDGHTNNQLADTLGDGGYGKDGDAKRVPSLLGVWSTGPWAWNGGHSVLHSQVAASLRSTMHTRDYRLDAAVGAAGEDDSDRVAAGGDARILPADQDRDEDAGADLAADLAAYLTTLSRPPSVASARREELHPADAAIGAALFEAQECATCHDPFTSLTTDGVFDVGLPDRAGHRRFNPPSLGGVSQRDRLLHDGRANSLDEVLSRYSHPNDLKLLSAERDALVAYLKGL